VADQVRGGASINETKPVLVDLREVSKSYPGVQALDGLSFSIARREIHALLGANGAGKSTLIKILAGATSRDGGEIDFEGRPLEELDPHLAVELGIVCLFQEPALVPGLTVEQNIFLGREVVSRLGLIHLRPQHEQALLLLRRVAPHLNPRQPVAGLRASERQFVALAKALLRKPRLLILDEPTASMTDPEIEALFRIVLDLKEGGASILYVTHRLEEVFQIADATTVLRDGRLVRSCAMSELARTDLVNLIAGRELRVEERRRDVERGRKLLSVQNISRLGIFSDITFDVHEGEVVALAGLVGAGRSEVVRSIFGADPLDEGSIQYPNGANAVQDPHGAVLSGVAMVPEDRKRQGIVPKMSVGDNLILSSATKYGGSLPGLIDFSESRALVARNVKQLDIRPHGAEDRAVETLSGGNQQKVLLGRAMESGARVLIFDEPTAGVDIGTKTEIQRLILELARGGKGIIIVSSEMEEVLALADRILVIREGRLVRELVGHSASSFDVLKSALGEDESLDADAARTA
jgi:ABC-type sugar transport system ATPase subunit